ncbi:DNA-directed DNA polymerase alpha catalytic subunit pol1 [Entophlyctis luteolus]|nr:DNA-directed DNA polymerase alpha catalytic subunit pol1 [Entophlyctis luteolus]
MDSDDDNLAPFGDSAAAPAALAPLAPRASKLKAAHGNQSRRERLELLKKSRRGEHTQAPLEKPKDLFESMTEEDYQRYVKAKLIEDDFVVDDDGQGYADYGMENDETDDSADDHSEAEDISGNRRGKQKTKRVRREARVSTFFSKQSAKLDASNSAIGAPTKPEPRIVTKPKTAKPVVVNEQDLLADIFGDIDAATASENIRSGTAIEAFNGSVASSFSFGESPKANETTTPAIHHDMFSNPFDRLMSEDEAENGPETTLNDNAISRTAEQTIGTSIEDQIKEEYSQHQTSDPSSDSMMDDATVTADPAFTIRKLETPIGKDTKGNHNRVVVSAARTFEPPKASESKEAGAEAPTLGCVSWTSVVDSFAFGNASPAEPAIGSAGTSSAKEFFEEDGKLNMFWFDAYEKDGLVYLFGKVWNKTSGSFVSCCVTVQNIERVLFVLPRLKKRIGNTDSDIDVTMPQVYEEFDKLRQKYGIKEHKSRAVSRKYAFEIPGVPVESDYLKVAYSYKYGQIPSDSSGSTFSHIFGTNTTALENFIIKRKLMGPCWIEIQNPKLSQKNISWAKVEVVCDNPKFIKPVTFTETSEDSSMTERPVYLKSAPAFVAMSVSLRTVMNHEKNINEIVSVCVLVYNNVSVEGTASPGAPLSYSAIRPLTNIPMPNGFKDLVANAKKSGRAIEVLPNEKGLLQYLMAIIHRTDPDILVGHNFIGVDLDILLHRLKANKVDLWSKIGRLRRTKWPKLQSGAGGAGDSTYEERTVASGRILCDTFMSAKEYVTKAKSYTLTNMALTQLKIVRQDLDPDKIPLLFFDAAKLMYLIKHCETDCILSASLMMKLQVLPLTKQLTALAGNLWSRTIMAGSRADRNEFLLLHEFHNRKFIVPDKTSRKGPAFLVDAQKDDDDEHHDAPKASSRRKPAYAGGLVLEPKKGLYEKFVLMLDFNSLYPSIIQEYNICFTTVERNAVGEEEVMPELPDASLPQGILPKLLATLVERRRAVKSLMKNPKLTEAEYSELNIRQQALKLTANSMYGCLGFTHSRFYAKPLAMLVTQRGREILQATVDLATNENLEVIYGDTDSIMIHTNTETLRDVIKCGNEFKKAVNKRYKLLEIEIDGIFKKMLLLKKKKYAALVVEEKDGKSGLVMEKKGLDVVRRDWCSLSHDASEFVLSAIFSDDGRDDMLEKVHEYLRKLGDDVRKGDVGIDKFVINKGLTKNPEDYADVKNQPHVQVALQMKAKGLSVRVGDTVPYVIVVGEGSGSQFVALLELTGKFVDFQYYLANQVLPPLSRLLSPIEGTDQGRIAACLGLDAAKFQNTFDVAELIEEKMYTLESTISEEERFKKCDKVHIYCPTCDVASEFPGLVRLVVDENGKANFESGLVCGNIDCKSPIPVPSVYQQFLVAMRAHIRRYMYGFSVCEERSCGARTKCIAVLVHRCQMPGCEGILVPEYSDSMLLTQLEYFRSLFSKESVVKRQSKNRNLSDMSRNILLATAHQAQEEAKDVLDMIQMYIDLNGRGTVDMGKLWENMGFGAGKTRL